MTTEKRKNKKQLWYVGGGVVLVALVVFVILLMISGGFKAKKDKEEASGEAETVVIDTNKKDEEPATEPEEPAEKKEEVVQFEGEDPNEGERLSGVITYAGVSGGKLMIRVNIDQYLDEGVCRLELKRGGSIIYSDETGVIPTASTATCEGFDVLASEVGEGDVLISIRLEAEGKEGEITGEAEV